KTKKLINRALKAVEAEIDAVREKPAQDVLFDGKLRKNHPPDAFYYEFKSQNRSLRFAELIRGEMDGYDEDLELYPVEVDDKEVVLHFPHNLGASIPKVSLEWENDFVLRKLKGELKHLLGDDEKVAR